MTHELELVFARLARERDELRVVVEAHGRDGRDQVLDRLAGLALGALGIRSARSRIVHIDDTGRGSRRSQPLVSQQNREELEATHPTAVQLPSRLVSSAHEPKPPSSRHRSTHLRVPISHT